MSHLDINQVDSIEVILKTAERCNLNCKYCYFFHGGDESYLHHPKYISFETIKEIAKFLRSGIMDSKIRNLQIDFHGGEPLLQKKAQFDLMCQHFKSELADSVNLSLALQTNASLIDEEWIELFEKHQIAASVSLDGPEQYNDQNRVDHRNRGSYQRCAQGIRKLLQAAAEQRIENPGVLCVINPEFDGGKIYRHFVDEFGFTHMDFLLPDLNHDSLGQTDHKALGRFLSEVLAEWGKDYQKKIFVRFLSSFMRKLLGKNSHMFSYSLAAPTKQAFTIASDGSLFIDDTLRTTAIWKDQPEQNIRNTSLREFLGSVFFHVLDEARTKIPATCATCSWEKSCAGGMIVNRYKSGEGFNNPSVWCAGLRDFYSQAFKFLLQQGFSYAELTKNMLA